MSTFRAFQTGLMAGQQQAKVRREDDARQKAADAWGKGNYEGASTSLMGVGLMDEADAYSKAGERKIEAERTKAYADAFKTGLGAGPAPNKRGGYEALGQEAAGRGDFDVMAKVDQALAGMDADQQEQFKQGMMFLGETALNLKSVAPEMRGQAAMEILQNSPYANPQILQQIQQAGADGKITDEELDNFAMQTMSVAERVKLAKQAAPRYSTTTTAKGVMAYNTADPNDQVFMGAAPPRANESSPPPSGYRWKSDGTLERIPGGPADKPAGPEYTQKQVTDYTNSAKTLDALEGAVNQYQSLIDTYGPQLWDRNLNPLDNPGVRTVAAAKLDAARTAVDIQIKELFNLGVLNGPDLDIIRGAIPDLTGGEALGSSKENAKASLGIIYDYIKRGRNQVPEQFIQKARPNGAPQGTADQQYSPDQVAQAKAALANWDRIPAAFKTPQMRAMAEKIAGVGDQAQADPTEDAFIDGLFPEDAGDQVPDGVDPQDWEYFTPEMKQQYLAGAQ